jgi:kinetochore protein Mis13/DSN1
VPAGSFYKHIDGEQPDAARLAQLLIWCSSRAAAKKPDLPDKGPPLPPLSAKGTDVMRAVQAGVLRALAERRVDTVPSRPLSKPPAGKPESAQNVFNRQQVARFKADIDRYSNPSSAFIAHS